MYANNACLPLRTLRMYHDDKYRLAKAATISIYRSISQWEQRESAVGAESVLQGSKQISNLNILNNIILIH